MLEATKTTKLIELLTGNPTTKDLKWESLFAENRLESRGMSLAYIAPVIPEGEKIAKLNQLELEKGSVKWKQTVILYVIGATPSIGALKRYIGKQWNFAAKPKIYFHNDGYYVVKFNTLEDKDEVLYSGPHTINNKAIIIKPWEANFYFNEEVLRMIPLWVQFPNLSLNYWEMETLSMIRSVLGNPIYTDECITKVERISFARVLVEMDVTVPLPHAIKVQDPTGRIFEEEVWKQIHDQKNKHKEENVKKVIHKQEWKAKPGIALVIQSDNGGGSEGAAKKGNQTNVVETQRKQSGNQHEATKGVNSTLESTIKNGEQWTADK
ncbi:uncharacterized protein [Nicotiana tomentosiformis]|uniref:uncharacterized protein n=1 Tax=Nicotiana tomentosiformis TaxID=4098 RepID=UPI00388C8B64